MPKNQFQRPTQVKHTSNVPRHGAPQPEPRKDPRKGTQPLPGAAPLPSLDALMAKLQRD